MKKMVVEFCGKCGIRLNDNNWFPSFKKSNSGTCKRCANRGFATLYCITCGSALENQRCAACDAKRACTGCGDLLTDDNWGAFNRKRFLLRCNACHYKITGAWQKDHPESSRARTRRWRDRNPDHWEIYYRDHRDEHLQRSVERLWRMKIEAINKLGGKCAGCGTEDMRVLQVNHLNGRNGDKLTTGHRIYKAIIEGTCALDDLDIRCANCNVIYEYERGNRSLPSWFTVGEDILDVDDLEKEE